MTNTIIPSKKAASAWISYVLLLAFVVALSAIMYKFMIDHTEKTTDDIKKAVYDTDECRLVSLNIESVCLSSQVLNITLENTNYIRIEKLDFRLYNGVTPIHTNYTNTTLNPNRKKVVSLGIGTSSNVTLIEAIAHVTKDNMDIICSNRKVQATVTSC
jgi:hypothetical protein